MALKTHINTTFTTIITLLIIFICTVLAQDCPCSWRDDNREWRCDIELEAVPTHCWPIHENIQILHFTKPLHFGSHDLDHENLLNLGRLEITGALSFTNDSLRTLRNIWYLSITNGEITELPDLSSITELTTFEVSHNNLQSLPSLSHMGKLRLASIHHNQIISLPDRFLPENIETTSMSAVQNSLTELNASSIVYAGRESSFTFDDDVWVVWATEDENDILIDKDFYCNIDLVGIVKIIDNPTNPKND